MTGTDDKTDKPLTGTSAEAAPLTGGKTEISALPPDIQQYIDELRKENAKWRTEKKKAEEAARRADEKRLEENQQYKELAESRLHQITELEAYRQKSEELEAGYNAALEARLSGIPVDVRRRLIDPIRSTMPALEFGKWLDANAETLRVKRAPNMDAGAGAAPGTGGDGAFGLSAEELEICRRTHVPPERYAARKKEIAAGKPAS